MRFFSLILLLSLSFVACLPNTNPRTHVITTNTPVGLHAVEGIASWYGPNFVGKPTANGEIFDPNQLTAAHKTIPFGTFVTVRNLDNNRTVMVRINDRGPFKDNRIIDLSRAAAEQIDMIRTGTARVRLEFGTSASATGSELVAAIATTNVLNAELSLSELGVETDSQQEDAKVTIIPAAIPGSVASEDVLETDSVQMSAANEDETSLLNIMVTPSITMRSEVSVTPIDDALVGSVETNNLATSVASSVNQVNSLPKAPEIQVSTAVPLASLRQTSARIASDMQLSGLNVLSEVYPIGQLLLLQSQSSVESEPLMVRVSSNDMPISSGVDLFVTPELFGRLGEFVVVYFEEGLK